MNTRKAPSKQIWAGNPPYIADLLQVERKEPPYIANLLQLERIEGNVSVKNSTRKFG